MIVTTKYKTGQFVLEIVTLCVAVVWMISGLVLYFNFAPEEQIQKRNMLIFSMIFTVLIYTGLSVITILPAGNGLINTKRYRDGDDAFRYKRESALRTVFQWIKLAGLLLCVLMGTFCYFPDIAQWFSGQ